MTLLTDEQRATLLSAGVRAPHVNESCIGCSACVAISGEVFELDDEGKSQVKHLEKYEDLDVDDSIMACPVDAISWKE